jgi:WD40 repeat protein
MPEKYVYGDSLKPKDGIIRSNFAIPRDPEESTIDKATTAKKGGYRSQPIKGVGRAILNSNGTRLFYYSDENACLWNPQVGEKIGKDMIHGDLIIGARFNIYENLILTWSRDGTARIWHADSGESSGIIFKHSAKIKGALFNSDETSILTWSEDGMAKLWEANTGKQVGDNMEHDDFVLGAIFNTSETRILTWSDDQTVKMWEAHTGKQIGTDMLLEEVLKALNSLKMGHRLFPGGKTASLSSGILIKYVLPCRYIHIM